MTKEFFTLKYETQIMMYEYLLKGSSICHNIIKKFDGKVINVRFTNAMKDVNTLQGIFYSMDGDDIRIMSNEHRSFKTSKETCDYIDTDRMYFRPVLNGNRLDAAETIKKLVNSELDIKNRIKDCRYCIDHWNEHADDLQKIENMVQDYTKKWPAQIRGIITIGR